MSEQHAHDCPGCGIDHEEELRNALPEIALLDKSYETMKDTSMSDLMTEAVALYMGNIVMSNQNDFIMGCHAEGDLPQIAVTKFATLMMKTGFLIGAAVADTYRERIPSVSITDEEREAFVQEHWDDQRRAREAAQSIVQPSQELMVRLMKEAGLIPDDFEGEVKLVNLGEIPSASEEGGGSTGMYL